MKDAFTPVLKQSLADSLAQHIRRLIQAGSYQEGDRLPSIMEMARRFGVGHPTVREGLQKLATMGIVEIRHGSGVYISKNQDVFVLASTDYTGAVTKELLLDLIRARTPIEVTAVAAATRNATAEHLDEMKRLLDDAGRSLGDDAVLNAVNMAFHREIALASGNTVLLQVLDVLQELFVEEQRLILSIFGSRQRDHEEHLAILEAIERRDEELAVDRMRTHLEGVEQVLLLWDPADHPVS
jgi:GntR family transcriptional repressor for pyruvate dehydrogenase complex